MMKDNVAEVLYISMPLLLLSFGLYLEGLYSISPPTNLFGKTKIALDVAIENTVTALSQWLLQLQEMSHTLKALLIFFILCLFICLLNLQHHFFRERWKPTLM